MNKLRFSPFLVLKEQRVVPFFALRRAEGGAFFLFEAEGEEGGGDFLVDGLGMVGKGATVSFA